MFRPIVLARTCRIAPRLSVLPRCRYMQTVPTAPTPPTAPSLPTPPALTELNTEEDNAAASAWVKGFSEAQGGLTRHSVELTFSRSSGPGGQNVNKVNTKVTLRCPLSEPWIPRWAVPNLEKDTHYAASTHSILVTSTVHRSQAENINEGLSKLHSIILSAASQPIKHEPSAEQKKKVEGLIKAEKTRRKTDKIHRSSVKQGRSGKGGAFDL